MIKVILCKNFEKAKEIAKEIKPCVAVECEYGDDVLTEDFEGVELAFYHHGKFAYLPAPSERWDIYEKLEQGYDNFIISHRDLDTLMGIMWASKILKPESLAKKIGELVALQDINGFHWLEKNILPNLHPDLKYRFLGLGLILSTRDIEVDNGELIKDVSKSTHKIILKLKDMIIDGPNEKQKVAIDNWMNQKKLDAEKDLIFTNRKINFFMSDKNLLSAYHVFDFYPDINIVYNYRNGSILISAFDEKIAKKYFGNQGVIRPLKEFFGDKAGGRITVGGTPRDQVYNREKAEEFLKFIIKNYNIGDNKIINEKIL